MAFFGEGFSYTESKVSLDNGVHQAKIINVEGVQNDYGKHLEVTLEMDGQAQSYPNSFWIFERPTEGMTTRAGKEFTAEQRQHMWDAEYTKFFISFGIEAQKENPFQNFKKWIGHTGAVTVQQQKTRPDYKEVIPYAKTIKEEPPKPAPAPASTDSFPEDIPF